MLNSITDTKMALLSELIPFFIQLIGIITLLFVAFSNHFHSLSAAILSIIWLKVSKSELPDDFRRMRMQRLLFEKLGNWVQQPTASEDYDKAHEDIYRIDRILGNDVYQTVMVAKQRLNFARYIASIILSLYLVYISSQVFIFM